MFVLRIVSKKEGLVSNEKIGNSYQIGREGSIVWDEAIDDLECEAEVDFEKDEIHIDTSNWHCVVQAENFDFTIITKDVQAYIMSENGTTFEKL